MTKSEFKQVLRNAVEKLPMAGAGVVHPEMVDSDGLRAVYEAWLQAGNHDFLAYLDRSVEQRSNPFMQRPWARSALVISFSGDWSNRSAPPSLPSPPQGEPVGMVSEYAFGPDYHGTGRQIMVRLIREISQAAGGIGEYEICIDTAAVPDTALAFGAGLGTLGFNHLLRDAVHGSRLFVATAFLERELPRVAVGAHAAEVTASCENCRRCIEQCPNHALRLSTGVQLELCRSYLTIEHRGAFTYEQCRLVGDALFGCDICTAACPPQQDIEGFPVDLDWLLRASAGEVGRAIAGSALAYTGVSRLRRNAVAILALQRNKFTAAGELLDFAQKNSHSPIVNQTLHNL